MKIREIPLNLNWGAVQQMIWNKLEREVGLQKITSGGPDPTGGYKTGGYINIGDSDGSHIVVEFSLVDMHGCAVWDFKRIAMRDFELEDSAHAMIQLLTAKGSKTPVEGWGGEKSLTGLIWDEEDHDYTFLFEDLNEPSINDLKVKDRTYKQIQRQQLVQVRAFKATHSNRNRYKCFTVAEVNKMLQESYSDETDDYPDEYMDDMHAELEAVFGKIGKGYTSAEPDWGIKVKGYEYRHHTASRYKRLKLIFMQILMSGEFSHEPGTAHYEDPMGCLSDYE